MPRWLDSLLHSLHRGNVPAYLGAVISALFGFLSWRSSRRSKAAEREAKQHADDALAAQKQTAEETKRLATAQERQTRLAEHPGMQQQNAIEFFFIEKASSLWGFHWLIEWSTSSFYIKCLHPGLQSAKVSLHGPDPKHPGKQHLRFDLDKPDLGERATRAGGRWSRGSDPLPYYFSGRQVSDRAAHIVRFSAEWDTFIKGAPGPGNSRGPRQKSTFRAQVGAPEKDHVSHVDVYLSFGDPYWPDEPGVRAASAGMGPITNAIGMHLTAVSVQRPVTLQPDPYGDLRGDTPLNQCVRGVAAVVDETSLLWLCEKVVPIAEFDAPATG